jgi:hypothetical protein
MDILCLFQKEYKKIGSENLFFDMKDKLIFERKDTGCR